MVKLFAYLVKFILGRAGDQVEVDTAMMQRGQRPDQLGGGERGQRVRLQGNEWGNCLRALQDCGGHGPRIEVTVTAKDEQPVYLVALCPLGKIGELLKEITIGRLRRR